MRDKDNWFYHFVYIVCQGFFMQLMAFAKNCRKLIEKNATKRPLNQI